MSGTDGGRTDDMGGPRWADDVMDEHTNLPTESPEVMEQRVRETFPYLAVGTRSEVKRKRVWTRAADRRRGKKDAAGVVSCEWRVLTSEKKVLDLPSLRRVLTRIRAPRDYLDNAADIIWEVNDSNPDNYVDVNDVVRVFARIVQEQKGGNMIVPARLVNIVDFVSKDTGLTGYISARQVCCCCRSLLQLPFNAFSSLIGDPCDICTMCGLVAEEQCILLLHNRFGGDVKSHELRNLLISQNSAGSSKVSFQEYLEQVRIRQMMLCR